MSLQTALYTFLRRRKRSARAIPLEPMRKPQDRSQTIWRKRREPFTDPGLNDGMADR